MNQSDTHTTYDLIVLGDLVADIILPVNRLPLRPNEHDWADGLYTELGGSCTTLVAARRVALSVAALGMVGDDAYGADVLQMLAAEGVETAHVVVPHGRQTVLCVVVTDKAGQHVFLGIKDDQAPERCPPQWQDVVRRCRSVFTTGYTLRDMLNADDVLSQLAAARSADVPVFFDPGPSITALSPEMWRRALEVTTVLLLTEEEAYHVTQARQPEGAARELLACGPQAVVLKRGEAGCIISSRSANPGASNPVQNGAELIRHEGFDVQAASLTGLVDTVGAGDAFVAAFIAAYLRGGSWQECAALANAMGAAVAATRGAGRSVPDVERVAALLAGDPAQRLLFAA